MKLGCIVPRIVATVVTVIAALFINYIFLPAWSFHSSGMYAYIFVIGVIAAFAFFIADTISYDENHVISISICIAVAIIFIIIIIGAITSAKIFHASQYQSLLEIENGNFEEDVVHNSFEEIAVVDVSTAERLGDRTLANLSNPSWYEVDDEYNLILYNGIQYRISPINYGGFFEYNKANSTGIPGYVLVNACTQEAKLITLENSIRYSPSAYFNYNLRRHLRGQFPSYVFGKSFFEIDDDGNPYWITSVKKANIGLWGGKTENSFIITNAISGESEEFKVDEVPNWVDHAFDLDYLMDMVYFNYAYVNGYFNFSKTDIKRTSYYYKNNDGFTGYNTTLSSDGIVFYTGVTPANSAESIIGFIFANPRTGVVKFYSCSGAEESSAQAAAQGLVQNLGYTATFPTIVSIDGLPTYFMVLKDNAGLIQRYAFSNVANYSLTVQAPNLEDAIVQYRQEVGLDKEITNNVESNSVTGVIDFLSTVEVDGNTYFYFTLVNDTSLYMSSIKNSSRQVFLNVGTTVTIEFISASEENTKEVIKINF